MDQRPNLGWRLGWDLLIHPTLDWYFFYLELKVALDSIKLVPQPFFFQKYIFYMHLLPRIKYSCPQWDSNPEP